ncbi:glycosyltransferase family 2 protein [Stenotrophomonas sp. PSU-St19]
MTHTHPLVSVVIPAYNREETIVGCINSALNQSYSNIEIVVVDDGSKDATADVVESTFVGSRVRLVRQENQGANVARNHGIDAAKGKYVALLDSDDEFKPDHIQTSVAILEAASAPTLVYSQVIVDRGNGVNFLKPDRSIQEGENMSEYLLCRKGFVQTSSVVLPRDFAARVRYLPSLPVGQDVDFAIRCWNAGMRFVMKPTPGAIWHDHFDPNRISSSAKPAARQKWLEDSRHILSNKAAHGFTGWFLAKSYAKSGHWGKGVSLYLSSIIHRPYTAKHSVVVFLQVAASGSFYRRLADTVIGFKSKISSK